MGDTEIKITDLDEMIDSEANLIKIAGYTIDLNKVPLKVLLEVKKILKNTETLQEEVILKNVIFPLIKSQNEEAVYNDKFEELFTVPKITRLWNEIIKVLYGIDMTIKNETKESKKKQ